MKKKAGKNNTAKGRAKSKTAKTKAKRTAKTTVTKKPAIPKRVSALAAAATVLRNAGKPMRSRELITAMTEQGLWSSPNGKTPHATIYAAMLREVAAKGTASRFKKVERGLFAFNG